MKMTRADQELVLATRAEATKPDGCKPVRLSVSGTGIAANQLFAASSHDRFSILRAASVESLYAAHGPEGLTHFVFSDTTFLVSCEWGGQFLAVNPDDTASWNAYVKWMAEHDAVEHILVEGEMGARPSEDTLIEGEISVRASEDALPVVPRAILH